MLHRGRSQVTMVLEINGLIEMNELKQKVGQMQNNAVIVGGNQ